jgi:hypothetical protein
MQLAVHDDRMIEDLLIWKFVAEHPHCTRANSNPVFSTVIVCTIALVGPSPRKQSTNAVILLTSNSKQFRLNSSGGFHSHHSTNRPLNQLKSKNFRNSKADYSTSELSLRLLATDA